MRLSLMAVCFIICSGACIVNAGEVAPSVFDTAQRLKEDVAVPAEIFVSADNRFVADVLTILAAEDAAEAISKAAEAKIDVDAENSNGGNALIAAIATESLSAAAALIEAGANPDISSSRGRPAELAAAVGSLEMKKIVLQRSSLNLNDRLRSAARQGDVEAINELISIGADPNAADDESVTPLMEAVQGGSVAAVSALLKSGASVNGHQVNAMSAIGLAVMNGRGDLTEILLSSGAKAIESVQGVSLLTLAVLGGNMEVVDLLLRHGASKDAAEEGDGIRPAAIAKMIGEDALAEKLGGVPELLPKVDMLAAIQGSDPIKTRVALDRGGAGF